MSDPKEPLTPEQHRVWEKFKEDVKKFGKWYFIGTLATLAFGLIGPAGDLLGIQQVNISDISSPADLYVLMTGTTWQTALFVFACMVSIGGVAVFLAASQMKFGKLVRLHNDAVIEDEMIDKEIKAKMKKLRVLPMATFGVYMGVMFVMIAGLVYITTGVNMGNIHSFLNAYYSHNILAIVIVSIGTAFYAYLMKHFESEYEKVFNKIEPYVKKTKFL